MNAAATFAPLLTDVATELLGKPDQTANAGATLRWGARGSLKLDTKKGVWHDKEANEGGGVLDLVMRERSCDKAGALEWMESKGFIDPPERKEPERYPYRDASGAILYAKVRVNKPDRKYEYQHPVGDSWRAGRGGINAVPYRLPNLLAAPKDAVLYMAEGEKHADKLASWGLLATSLKDWREAYSQHVAGRVVIILPDNDDGGRKQATDAATLVVKAGGKPVLLELPGLGHKEDIMDWRGSREEFAALAKQAIANPPDPETIGAKPLPGETGPEQWNGTKAPPREFVVDGWIARGAAGLLGGQDGVGKSLLAQLLATCCATGRDFLGLPVNRCRTIYTTCEDPGDEMHRRQEDINQPLGIGMADLAGWFKVYSWKGEIGNELATFDQHGRLTPTERYEQLRRAVLDFGAQLVFVDNAAHVFSGNENARHDVAAFLGLLERLSIEINGAVILLAHPNKQHSQGNKQGNEYSGTTGWSAHVRNRMFLDWTDDEADPDQRVLRRSKANYAAKGEEILFRWHRWTFVRDEDLPSDYAQELAESIKATRENDVFLACLRARMEVAGREVGPSVGPNYAPARFAEMTEARGLNKKQLTRAMERLFHIGAITTKEVKREGKGGSKTIIVETSPNTPEPTPEPVPNYSPEPPLTTPEHPRAYTHITKVISGAATEAAAPIEEEVCAACSGVGCNWCA